MGWTLCHHCGAYVDDMNTEAITAFVADSGEELVWCSVGCYAACEEGACT